MTDSDMVNAGFVELVPGVRVVQAVDSVSDDPANAGAMPWELTAAVGAATARVATRAGHVPARISRRTRRCLGSSLANLAALLER